MQNVAVVNNILQGWGLNTFPVFFSLLDHYWDQKKDTNTCRILPSRKTLRSFAPLSHVFARRQSARPRVPVTRRAAQQAVLEARQRRRADRHRHLRQADPEPAAQAPYREPGHSDGGPPPQQAREQGPCHGNEPLIAAGRPVHVGHSAPEAVCVAEYVPLESGRRQCVF